MTREELGRVAYEAYHRANEDWDTNTFVTWDTYPDAGRERWQLAAEAVRTAVIAAEFGPHASVVTTEYLTALEETARAGDAFTERWGVQINDNAEHGRSDAIAMARDLNALRHQLDGLCKWEERWQRKGEQP